jgi:hypothetical protein
MPARLRRPRSRSGFSGSLNGAGTLKICGPLLSSGGGHATTPRIDSRRNTVLSLIFALFQYFDL